MRHAAHKAARVSDERFSAAKALFTSSRGSHTAKAVRSGSDDPSRHA